MDKRIHFLQNQMLANPQSQPSIEEMAKSVNLSASHLLKLFKTEVGMSPVQYMRTMRLEKARELLEESFLRVSVVSLFYFVSIYETASRFFTNNYSNRNNGCIVNNSKISLLSPACLS